ncbi:probable serine/threonine-protein kinase roco5 [Saccostrea cucullata]|uniref:probable serine/threonine-protein kinase roco5 n=1 Tax=Saccostrea cuccullata TaxID=36930 RepID=UPI002ED16CD6
MPDEVQTVDVGEVSLEAPNRGQLPVSHDDSNIPSTSSYGGKRASSPENVREVIEEGQTLPSSSNLSGSLQIESKNLSDDHSDKKITMTDFAGQCSYYASHQIFLSPRAFFILVLNMEKKFDDKVGEEVCCQNGSIYMEWTNRDYLEFWMKSLHQYSNEKAPVILVATHSENKTPKVFYLFT